jgi:altronate dehydratase
MTVIRSLLLSPVDSVAVALSDASKGDRIEIPTQDDVVTQTDIPGGHKVAVVPISEGEVVLKYGEPIGVASRSIARGEHVHVQNLRSARAGRRDGS